jgi:hypothetical protein
VLHTKVVHPKRRTTARVERLSTTPPALTALRLSWSAHAYVCNSFRYAFVYAAPGHSAWPCMQHHVIRYASRAALDHPLGTHRPPPLLVRARLQLPLEPHDVVGLRGAEDEAPPPVGGVPVRRRRLGAQRLAHLWGHSRDDNRNTLVMHTSNDLVLHTGDVSICMSTPAAAARGSAPWG